ncbi:MAG: Mur ligase family protein [bacterium]
MSGTKGKSTTATLTYETLKTAGKSVQLIGNIGNPVLDYLNIQDLSKQQEEMVVFEISSYMLDGLKKHNYISVLLNIYADHLDWHEGFENYKNAKLNILSGSEHLLIRDEITQRYPDFQKNIADQSFSIF